MLTRKDTKILMRDIRRQQPSHGSFFNKHLINTFYFDNIHASQPQALLLLLVLRAREGPRVHPSSVLPTALSAQSRQVYEAVCTVAFHRHHHQVASEVAAVVAGDGQSVAEDSQRGGGVEVVCVVC